jgi:hypothetical protein
MSKFKYFWFVVFVNWVQAEITERRAQGERFKINRVYVVIFRNTPTYGAEYRVGEEG